MNDEASTIHFVEPGGLGGVYQHTFEVARQLSERGFKVRLHTNRAAELDSGLNLCRCVYFFPQLKPRLLRGVATALSFVFRTVPHLIRSVRRGEVVHFEGLFVSPLSALAMMCVKLRGCRVVHSPHNTFSRSGTGVDRYFTERIIPRLTDATITFSYADLVIVTGRGERGFVAPLTQYVPPTSPELVDLWRARLAQGADRLVLAAGQVREDKGLDVLVRSAATWPKNWRLAIVGSDKGAWDGIRQLAEQLDVPLSYEISYVSLADFVATLRASDAVVCPYDVASQSGVLALSWQLGTPTLASDVGGLSELATFTIAEPLTPEKIEKGLRILFAIEQSEASAQTDAVAVHLAAYNLSPRNTDS